MRARSALATALVLVAVLGFVAAAGGFAWQRGWTWNRPDPRRFPVQGIDVSHHQGAIDWPSVAAERWIRFAYVKATEGADWIDPEFGRNWAEARREGLRVGAYHFFTFCAPGAEQARHFLRVVPAGAEALPAALDVESGGPCPRPAREEILREIAAWCTEVEAATRKAPVIYVTDESYRSILAGSGLANRLWIRNLLAEPVPASGEPWSFWQWHSRGRVRGVKGIVDLDAYRAAEGPFDTL